MYAHIEKQLPFSKKKKKKFDKPNKSTGGISVVS